MDPVTSDDRCSSFEKKCGATRFSQMMTTGLRCRKY
jgi:hypothetical protein